MTTQHTPTPWAFDQEADNSTDFWVFQSNGPARVAVECSEADAAFIVRACNAHDELVAALQECADVLDSALASLGYPAGIGDIALSNARAAIAKVSK